MQNAHKLSVYREARDLAVEIYGLTADFPPAERFGLSQQMRRAAVSIGSNIAEGCGRSGNRAFLPFLHYAIGSANELAFQLEIASALGHCQGHRAAAADATIVRTRRMLIRLAETVARRAMLPRRSSRTTHHSRPTSPSSSPGPAPSTRAAAARVPFP